MIISDMILIDDRRARFSLPIIMSCLLAEKDGLTLLRLFGATAFCAAISLIPGGSNMILPITCALMLVIGLPHGIFDYLTLQKMQNSHKYGGIIAVATYCAAAVGTWILWQIAPFASLMIFLIIATIHFSEDWSVELSRLGAASMAISMIALPSLFYNNQLSDLLSLVSAGNAGFAADYLCLIAPVFGLVATAHVIIDMTEKYFYRAGINTCLLIAALLLPPGVGFAVYFCLFHSPMHFAEGRERLMQSDKPPRNFYPYMVAACAIIVFFVIVTQPYTAINAKFIAATFQTLSILTVPHMLLSSYSAQQVKFHRPHCVPPMHPASSQ